MKRFFNARAMMVFSAAMFGTMAPIVRRIAVTSAELALYRAILAALLISGYLIATRQKIEFSKIKKELLLLLCSGTAMGFNWILLFQAYRYTTVSVSTLSYYFAPVIVTVLSPILFREKMTRRQIICFVMSTIGLVLVINVSGLDDNPSHLIGILFGLGAACLYATVVLVNKFIKNVSGIHRTLLQFLAAIIVLTPYVACTGGFHPEVLDSVGWICLLIVGLFHTGIVYCMYFTSLKELSGQEASILSYVDPLVAVVVSVVVLHEPITVLQIIGGAMILGFTLWNERSSS